MARRANVPSRYHSLLIIGLLVAGGAVTTEVLAQGPADRPTAQKTPPSKSPVPVEQALYLIRTTLLTLNDANRSGNYSVLRDLGSPGFQAKNSAADLAQAFAELRHRRFDLFAVAVAPPQLSAPPRLDDGMLRLTGYFETHPLQIRFDMLFQPVGNEWRLFALSVATPPAQGSDGWTFKSRWPAAMK